MVFKYKFPIGDWSNDGHGKCEWFMVQGEKPIQDVREAHFKAKEVLGFDIGSICKEYEESNLTDQIIEKLKELNFDNEILENSRKYIEIEDVINIWVFLLNYIDNSLKLKIIDDNIMTINFYGFDNQRRHLETPGYGLFE